MMSVQINSMPRAEFDNQITVAPIERPSQPVSPSRRRFLTNGLTLTGLFAASSFFVDSTSGTAHAQTEGLAEAGEKVPLSMQEWFSPQRTGQGYKSEVVGDTLVVEASNVSTAGSLPDKLVPKGAKVGVIGNAENGSAVIVGLGNPEEGYVRYLVTGNGTVRASESVREGDKYVIKPLGDGKPVQIDALKGNDQLTYGIEGIEFVLDVNGQTVRVDLGDPALVEKYDGGRIVLGTAGVNNNPGKATFSELTLQNK